MSELPHLKPLHSDQTLSEAKLALFERITSETLKRSLVTPDTKGPRNPPGPSYPT